MFPCFPRCHFLGSNITGPSGLFPVRQLGRTTQRSAVAASSAIEGINQSIHVTEIDAVLPFLTFFGKHICSKSTIFTSPSSLAKKRANQGGSWKFIALPPPIIEFSHAYDQHCSRMRCLVSGPNDGILYYWFLNILKWAEEKLESNFSEWWDIAWY